MGLDAIAYEPDEAGLCPCLLTIDGLELLAFDAATEAPRWKLGFERTLVGVFLAHPQVLPSGGANPWRAQSTTRAAVIVDEEGGVHLVDTTLGRVVAGLGSVGKPLAAASSISGATLALAVEEHVVVWRSGEQHRLALRRVRSLAFSSDGDTLAVGNDKGELRMYFLGGGKAPEERLRATLRGAITALAQHPDGSWVVVAAQGVVSMKGSATTPLHKLSPATRRACFDGNGGRLAMQTSERGIVVYEWPRLSVLMRVEYTERPICGMSFGPDNWLGVALDHGDANKIDVVTSNVNRTDTHPGREHRTWTLLVEGKKERLSANEADEIRRMKDPFHTPAPAATGGGGGLGLRIGVGAMISLALLSVRVCVRMSTPSTSWSSPTMYSPPSLANERCDPACARGRLRMLELVCDTQSAGCGADATAAVRALEDGRCGDAKAAVSRMSAAPGTKTANGSALSVEILLAKIGLDEACASGLISRRVVRHAELVRLKGPHQEPSYEMIPEVRPEVGETPQSIWAAPDGSIFVATIPPPDAPDGGCVVYRSTQSGSWESVYEKWGSTRAELFGRSASDVYLMTDNVLAHFDGKRWASVAVPQSVDLYTSFGASGPDLYLAATDDLGTFVHRRQNGTWKKDHTPSEVGITKLFAGSSSTLWAAADDAQDGQVLLQRSSAGTWTDKSPPSDIGFRTINDVWVSSTGETFVATSDDVFRSKNAGTTWTPALAPRSVLALWGRASNDVYGATREGLAHYDGKAWSTWYVGNVDAFTGTATEILVARKREAGVAAP